MDICIWLDGTSGYFYFDHFYFYSFELKYRKIIFYRDGRGVMVTKLDSDGEERESRRTLMLTAMCCPVGLFLLSYLCKSQNIFKTIQRLACLTC